MSLALAWLYIIIARLNISITCSLVSYLALLRVSITMACSAAKFILSYSWAGDMSINKYSYYIRYSATRTFC